MGTYYLNQANFSANPQRGGAMAWNGCEGGRFDNGSPLWISGFGSNIGSFKVRGGWKIRTNVNCFPNNATVMSPVYVAVDGVVQFKNVLYFEVAAGAPGQNEHIQV